MEIHELCRELSVLCDKAKALAAPYDAQMRTLEVARADALASLMFEMESLKAVIRPMILAQRQSVKVNGLAAIFNEKLTWDSATLLAMAQEVPAIMQCQRDSSYVTFR